MNSTINITSFNANFNTLYKKGGGKENLEKWNIHTQDPTVLWIVSSEGERFMEEGLVKAFKSLSEALIYCYDNILLADLSPEDYGLTFGKGKDIVWSSDIASSIEFNTCDEHCSIQPVIF